jgi:hypothetical protein
MNNKRKMKKKKKQQRLHTTAWFGLAQNWKKKKKRSPLQLFNSATFV